MDMEAAVRKLGGAWPPYRGIAPEDDKPGVLFSAAAFDLLYISNGPGKPSTGIGTRTEFEECARRLRNEPSFNDHPDAKCFVQNMDGKWFKNTRTDAVRPSGSRWYSAVGGWWIGVQQGEVIGDWKRTLRLRPEDELMKNAGTVKELMDDEGVPSKDDNGDYYSLRQRVVVYKEMAVEAERNRRANEVPSAPDNDWIKSVREAFTKNAEEFDALLVTVLNRIGEREGAAFPDNIKTSRERVFLEAMNLIDREEGSVSLDAHRTIRILDNAGMLKMPEEKPE